MIDPLTRQPIMPPNGLTAPAPNLQALQQPPQPNTAAMAQGVPAPQKPGPWGADPFKPMWGNGPGDGSYGAPNDNLVGAFASASPPQGQMQLSEANGGGMGAIPMPPTRPAFGGGMTPPPRTNRGGGFGDYVHIVNNNPNDPNMGAMPGVGVHDPNFETPMTPPMPSPNDPNIPGAKPFPRAANWGGPSRTGLGSYPGNMLPPMGDKAATYNTSNPTFGSGPIANSARVSPDGSNKLSVVQKAKNWAKTLMNGPVETQ